MRVLLTALVTLWTSLALADYPSGQFTQAQTRFGLLQVVGPLGQQRIQFNGADLGIENHAYAIDGVWAVQGGAQDWAVLTSRHGGNMCGGASQIAIMLTSSDVVRTNEFGVCQGGPIDVRVDLSGLEVDISDPSPRVTHRVFRFDGTNLNETPVVLQSSDQMPGAGAAVTRWLSNFPRALTEDPSEQLRFSRILTPAQMDELNTRLSGPGSIQQEGGWVVGRGCQAHACNLSYALWALRISDGLPLVIFRDNDPNSEFDTQQIFGGDAARGDPNALNMMMEILP